MENDRRSRKGKNGDMSGERQRLSAEPARALPGINGMEEGK